MIDHSSLEKALATLQEASLAHDQSPSDLFIRDACIQRFEYSYELAHEMLHRHLAATEPNAAEIDSLTFPDMIRLAFARGLTAEEWATWRLYREARNRASHAYDARKAEEVMRIIPTFLASAWRLLEELKRHQTGAMSQIDIRPQDLDILRFVLKSRLPHHVRVYVFGSRATGRARRASDLDLAIDAGRPLTLDERAGLCEAFSESDLPYKVDVADIHSIDEAFLAVVEREKAALLLI